MACFHPLTAWWGKDVLASGKRRPVFQRRQAHPLYADLPFKLPCGQCIGCRLEKSRQWAMRCTHEASLYDDNIFITLTYDNEHLPENRGLDYRHFQLFMKRLKVNAARKLDFDAERIRFYMCGEYGETFGRPHYHALLFNFDLPDKQLWKMERENPLFISEFLTDTWGQGHTSVGAVTFQSAAYVARYVMKKVTGDEASDHYEWIDPETGEIHDRKPEFNSMSRGGRGGQGGIGSRWFQAYMKDVFPFDEVIINGKPVTPPRYYTNQYELLYPDEVAEIKKRRKAKALRREADNAPDRLRVREKVLQARLTQLKRTIE